MKNDLEAQLFQTQKNNQDIVMQLNEKQGGLESEKEKLYLVKHQKDRVEEKSVENDQILKLQEELESVKHRRQKLEDNLSNVTAQLGQFKGKLEGRDITFVTQGRIFSLL